MFSIYNNMRNFLSYNSQDVDLIRKCTDIHHRSRSRDLSKDSKSTKIANYGLEELEGTKKIPKFYMRQMQNDQFSTKKKNMVGQREKVEKQVSEFAIKQEKSEQSSILKPRNLKQNASYIPYHEQQISMKNRQIIARIDDLRNRLEFQLYKSQYKLARQPLASKFITQKHTYILKE